MIYPSLIALDWGTSNLRASMLDGDGDGAVLAIRSAAAGVMVIPERRFAEALLSLCGDWLAAHPRCAWRSVTAGRHPPHIVPGLRCVGVEGQLAVQCRAPRECLPRKGVGQPTGWRVARRMLREKPSRPSASPRRLPALWLAALLTTAPWAPARAASDAASYDETANCIAVMQTNADELARQVKGGNQAQEQALRTELVRAAALVGRTYLNGLHDSAEAKARLKAAQERQAVWGEARKANVRQACLKRADAEMAAASGSQRFIVEHVAQATMRRMLQAH